MFKRKFLLALSLILAVTASSSVWAQQYARPDATTDAGTPSAWTAVPAVDHFLNLNEVTADDTDYIDSGNGNNSTVILRLSDVTDPDPGGTPGNTNLNDHILRYHCQSTGGGGAKERCTAVLYDGATPIFDTGNSNATGGAFALHEFVIPDASGITDYTNLSIYLTASNLDVSESIQLSWFELEVPAASSTTAPAVTTDAATGVTQTEASLGGTVSSDGGDTVTDVGVYWNAAPGAAEAGTKASMTIPAPITDPFSGVISSLSAGTTYNFKAFATNGVGETIATNELQFTTDPGLPTLDPTPTVQSIVADGATLGGTMTSDGGGAISDCGVEWGTATGVYGTSQSFGICVANTPFTVAVSGLTTGTTYYFRAYASNPAGPAYSGEGTFKPATKPAVATNAATGVTQNQATLGGTVSSDGGDPVTDVGVYWHTAPGAEAGTKVSMTIPTPITDPFSGVISSLSPGTTYYFKAYATNPVGETIATNERQFITDPGLATIATRAVQNLTSTTADLGGDVTSNGGSLVTDRGIVWDTAGNPETGGTAVLMDAGIGPFVATVTYSPPVAADSLVYFQAYATNTVGTAYSTIQSFQNVPGQPTNIIFTRVTGKAMRFSWTAGAGDGSIVVMRLFGTTETPPQDSVDYLGQPVYTDAPEVASSLNFVVYKGSGNSIWVTGLTLDTTYSIAIYSYTGSGASTVYDPIGPAKADQATTLVPVHNYDNRVSCALDCHNAHSGFLPRSDELTAVCEACHSPGGLAETKQEFANHVTPTKNLDVAYVDCGSCHELHNPNTYDTTESTHSITLATQPNKSFLRANVEKYVNTVARPKGDFPLAYLHTDQPLRESGNPNGDPPQAAINPDRAVEGGDDITARGYCQACHSLTANHRSKNTAGADQCHDGGGGNCGPAETHCGSCHQHTGGFAGAGDCTTCHNQPQDPLPRPTITTQFDRVSSHITGGSTVVTEADCLVCHDQTGHSGDQIVGLRDVDDGVSVFNQLTAGAPTTSTGEGEQFVGNCLSCHDDGVASSLAADAGDGTPTTGQTQTSPFTNSGQPPVIDPTVWGSAAHNRLIATVGSSVPMTCIGDGANGCHGSGHGSEKLKLWAPATGGAISPTDFCLNCHDGSTPPAPNIAAEFTVAIDQQYTGGGGYATVNKKHDVLAADQAFSGATVSCKDCHSPHADNLAEPVHNPDTDASLATYNTTNSYSYVSPIDGPVDLVYDSGGATDFNPTKPMGSPSQPDQPDHVEFCLTCHDGTAPPGVTMPGSMLNIAETYRTTDQHGRLVGTSSASRGYLKPPWVDTSTYPPPAQPPQGYAALPCTLCHGPHGSPNIYNLRESITVAGQQMNVGGVNAWEGESGPTYILPGGANQEEFGWGAWCTFCHEPSHDTRDGLGCQSGHTHGGGNF